MNSAIQYDGLVSVEACKWVPVTNKINVLSPSLELNSGVWDRAKDQGYGILASEPCVSMQ